MLSLQILAAATCPTGQTAAPSSISCVWSTERTPSAFDCPALCAADGGVPACPADANESAWLASALADSACSDPACSWASFFWLGVYRPPNQNLSSSIEPGSGAVELAVDESYSYYGSYSCTGPTMATHHPKPPSQGQPVEPPRGRWQRNSNACACGRGRDNLVATHYGRASAPRRRWTRTRPPQRRATGGGVARARGVPPIGAPAGATSASKAYLKTAGTRGRASAHRRQAFRHRADVARGAGGAEARRRWPATTRRRCCSRYGGYRTRARGDAADARAAWRRRIGVWAAAPTACRRVQRCRAEAAAGAGVGAIVPTQPQHFPSDDRRQEEGASPAEHRRAEPAAHRRGGARVRWRVRVDGAAAQGRRAADRARGHLQTGRGQGPGELDEGERGRGGGAREGGAPVVSDRARENFLCKIVRLTKDRPPRAPRSSARARAAARRATRRAGRRAASPTPGPRRASPPR